MVPTNGFQSKASRAKDKFQTFSRPRSGDVLDRSHFGISNDLRHGAVLMDSPTLSADNFQQQRLAPLQYIVCHGPASFNHPYRGTEHPVAEPRRPSAPPHQSSRNDRLPSSGVRLSHNDLRHQIHTARATRPTASTYVHPDTPGDRVPSAQLDHTSDYTELPRAAKRRLRRQRTTAELFAAAKTSERLGADLQTALQEAQANNARMADFITRLSAGELHPPPTTALCAAAAPGHMAALPPAPPMPPPPTPPIDQYQLAPDSAGAPEEPPASAASSALCSSSRIRTATAASNPLRPTPAEASPSTTGQPTAPVLLTSTTPSVATATPIAFAALAAPAAPTAAPAAHTSTATQWPGAADYPLPSPTIAVDAGSGSSAADGAAPHAPADTDTVTPRVLHAKPAPPTRAAAFPPPPASAATLPCYSPSRPSYEHGPILLRPLPLSLHLRAVDSPAGRSPQTATPLGPCLPPATGAPCNSNNPALTAFAAVAPLAHRPLAVRPDQAPAALGPQTPVPRAGSASTWNPPQLPAASSPPSATVALLECDLSADEYMEAPPPDPDSGLAEGPPANSPPNFPRRGWAPRRHRDRPPRGSHHRTARPPAVHPSSPRLARRDPPAEPPLAGHRRRLDLPSPNLVVGNNLHLGELARFVSRPDFDWPPATQSPQRHAPGLSRRDPPYEQRPPPSNPPEPAASETEWHYRIPARHPLPDPPELSSVLHADPSSGPDPPSPGEDWPVERTEPGSPYSPGPPTPGNAPGQLDTRTLADSAAAASSPSPPSFPPVPRPPSPPTSLRPQRPALSWPQAAFQAAP